MRIYKQFVMVSMLLFFLIINNEVVSAYDEPIKCQAIKERLFVNEQLRDVIITTDLLNFSRCMNNPLLLKDYAFAIANDYNSEMFQLCETKENLMTAEQKKHADTMCNSTDPKCNIELSIHKTIKRKPTQCKIAKAYPGNLPFSKYLGRLGTKGHYEITTEAIKLTGMKISKDGEKILCDASQDPDFYEFDVPQSHAQTQETRHGYIKNQDGAKKKFYEWGRTRLINATTACKSGDTRTALYWVGDSLHAVHDLVFHEGITNEEHAFLDKHEYYVDFNQNFDERFKMAIGASSELLNKIFKTWGNDNLSCVKELPSWEGKEFSVSEKNKLYNKPYPNFNIGHFFSSIDYMLSGGNKIEKYILGNSFNEDPSAFFLSALPNNFMKVKLKERRWLGGTPDNVILGQMLNEFMKFQGI